MNGFLTNLVVASDWMDDSVDFFDHRFDELRDEMRAGFSELRTEMRAGSSELRTEMRTGFAESRAEVMATQREMTRIGWAIAGALLLQIVAFVIAQAT